MPYLVPIGPKTLANFDVVKRGAVYDQETRPDALNAKNRRRQPRVSRLWTKEPSSKGDSE